ncbi:MAG: hypothetical protein LBR80_12725 [Deltaproteobacteria bacterium]|jgi:hypothetical protein|nr:hypothetical protein [Deltaproteobacteria bacterium]
MPSGKKNKANPPAALAAKDEFQVLSASLKAMCPDGFSKELFRDYLKCLFGFVESFRKAAARADKGGLEASRLEELLRELAHDQNGLNLRLLRDELSRVDQKPLIAKKKREAAAKGIRLKIYRRAPRTLITAMGGLEFSRLSLVKSRGGAYDSARFATPSWEMDFPLDEALGIDQLPYKMTCGAMLEISRHAAMSLSFEAAREILARERFIHLTGVTVRSVANTIGGLIFKEELKQAHETCRLWRQSKAIPKKLSSPAGVRARPCPAVTPNAPPNVKGIPPCSLAAQSADKGTCPGPEQDSTTAAMALPDEADLEDRRTSFPLDALCIALSETPIRMRGTPGETEPPPDRIMLGLVFTPNPSSGDARHSRKEYVPFLGPLKIFRDLILASAIRAGLAEAPGTVIITDGSPWVKGLRDELFPGAEVLLDLGPLEREIRRFSVMVAESNEQSPEALADRILGLIAEDRLEEAAVAARLLVPRSGPGGRHRLTQFLRASPDSETHYREGFSDALGPVERRQRAYLESRLRQSGMRWNLEHGQNILILAAKEISGLWESDVEARAIARFGNRHLAD